MNPKHIIFVDDDPAIQDAVQMMLEHVGYSVTVMSAGDALLETGFTHPDLFILDKQLPGVDGLDICRHLKTPAGHSPHSGVDFIRIAPDPDTGPGSLCRQRTRKAVSDAGAPPGSPPAHNRYRSGSHCMLTAFQRRSPIIS